MPSQKSAKYRLCRKKSRRRRWSFTLVPLFIQDHGVVVMGSQAPGISAKWSRRLSMRRTVKIFMGSGNRRHLDARIVIRRILDIKVDDVTVDFRRCSFQARVSTLPRYSFVRVARGVGRVTRRRKCSFEFSNEKRARAGSRVPKISRR